MAWNNIVDPGQVALSHKRNYWLSQLLIARYEKGVCMSVYQQFIKLHLVFFVGLKAVCMEASIVIVLDIPFHQIFDIFPSLLFEPSHEKTNNLGFRPGPT